MYSFVFLVTLMGRVFNKRISKNRAVFTFSLLFDDFFYILLGKTILSPWYKNNSNVLSVFFLQEETSESIFRNGKNSNP